MKGLTKARLDLIRQGNEPGGVHAVDYYKPLQWCLAQKLLISNGTRYVTTDLGKALLQRIKEAQRGPG